MAIARNFSAVVKIVEHSELQSELMFVGRNVSAVHGQRGIAVSDWKVAENLIVGAVFFQNIDDVADGILAAGEGEVSGVGVKKVVFFDLARICGEVLLDIGETDAGDGTGSQRRNIRMGPRVARARNSVGTIIGAAALAL